MPRGSRGGIAETAAKFAEKAIVIAARTKTSIRIGSSWDYRFPR